MFFLIRSAFWLTVVFTSLPPTVGERNLDLGVSVLRPGLAIVGAARDAALSGAKSWCVEKPAQCLADAARLTALVESARTDDGAADDSAAEVLPVPSADPRRHGRLPAHPGALTRG